MWPLWEDWRIQWRVGNTKTMPYIDKEKTKICRRNKHLRDMADPVKKEKHLQRYRDYRANNPDVVKDTILRSRLGISLEHFNNLVTSQNNKCAICRTEFSETPCIDHDHTCCSGVKSCGVCIRGLLCRKCNAGLGHFYDNLDLFKSAIDYLSYKSLKLEVI